MKPARYFTRRGRTYILALHAVMERSKLEAVVFQNPTTGQFLILPRVQFYEEFTELVQAGVD